MFYLPVNTVKQTFVAFVVFVDTTASFVAKIVSSLTVANGTPYWLRFQNSE